MDKKTKKNMSKKDFSEIEKLLMQKERVRVKEAKIFFDGRQYNLRIPAKFAKEMELNPAKDRVVFTLVQPENILRDRPRLLLEFKKG